MLRRVLHTRTNLAAKGRRARFCQTLCPAVGLRSPRRLQHVAKFHEVLEIPDAAVKAKIHTTFRLSYVRDVALPRALDDLTLAALHSMMMFNYMEILQSLAAVPDYFASLFARLRSTEKGGEEMRLLVTFLQARFCSEFAPVAKLRGRAPRSRGAVGPGCLWHSCSLAGAVCTCGLVAHSSNHMQLVRFLRSAEMHWLRCCCLMRAAPQSGGQTPVVP
jgi:Component of IIS longevity pathway SMK-1